jgi:hypothetical protein
VCAGAEPSYFCYRLSKRTLNNIKGAALTVKYAQSKHYILYVVVTKDENSLKKFKSFVQPDVRLTADLNNSLNDRAVILIISPFLIQSILRRIFFRTVPPIFSL